MLAVGVCVHDLFAFDRLTYLFDALCVGYSTSTLLGIQKKNFSKGISSTFSATANNSVNNVNAMESMVISMAATSGAMATMYSVASTLKFWQKRST